MGVMQVGYFTFYKLGLRLLLSQTDLVDLIGSWISPSFPYKCFSFLSDSPYAGPSNIVFIFLASKRLVV